MVRPQTTIQILRCFTLGGYTARVENGRLKTKGPQPLAGPLPVSIKARRDELVEFLKERCRGVWPPALGSELREIQRLLDRAPSDARDRTRIHIPTTRRAGLITYDYDEWPEDIAYIGRRYTRAGYNLPNSDWHNPFYFDKEDKKRDGSREEVVAKYRAYLLYRGVEDYRGKVHDGRHLLPRLAELGGKTIACWCKADELCHGDVLLELLGARPRGLATALDIVEASQRRQAA